MVTIDALHCALLEPAKWLRSLKDARLIEGCTPCRTTLFAEAHIEWQGAKWLLSLPLTRVAFEMAAAVDHDLVRLARQWLGGYQILYNELSYLDGVGELRRAHLVLERLPEGRELARSSDMLSASRLLEAVDLLRDEFEEAEFSHNNLKINNIYINPEGLLFPIRLHYARSSFAPDEFSRLRNEIGERFAAGVIKGLPPLRYDNRVRWLGGHLSEGIAREGLVRVQDCSGFGFVDTANREVIPARYDWTSEMIEGRAEVCLGGKMGLINQRGEFIIPLEYKQVKYNAERSLALVGDGERWAVFDYNGRQVTPFGERAYIPQEITKYKI